MKAVAKPVEVDFYIIESSQDDEGNWMVYCSEGKAFKVTPAMVARESLSAYYYVVVQADGYVYLNPKDVFERKYQPL